MEELRIKTLMYLDKFSHEIEKINFDVLYDWSVQNQESTNGEHLNANSIENIETGISGYLLFLLELYKVKKDKGLIEKIESITNDLIAYCKETPTNNYSFYTGRGGLVYFLLELYSITKSESLLQESYDLIKNCEGEFFESLYTSNYFYDGRSGTLFLLVDLYNHFKTESLLLLINKFCNKIIVDCNISKEGVSWDSSEEYNIKDSCGFSHGVAGILYVLKKIKNCFDNECIDYFINESEKYLNNCWDESKKNWLNFEIKINSSNTISQYIVKYNSNEKDHLPKESISWSNGKSGIARVLNYKNINVKDLLDYNFVSTNIFSGVSGVGLCFLDEISNDELLANEFYERVTNNENYKELLKGGLMYGGIGSLYFLIKLISEDKNSVVLPNYIIFENGNEKLSLDYLSVNLGIIKKHFFKTLTYIEIHDIKTYDNLINLIKNCNIDFELKTFCEFIELKSRFNYEGEYYQSFMDLYEYEKKKFKFFINSTNNKLESFLESISYRKQIIERLNESENQIFQKPIKISNRIEIINSRWDWSSNEVVKFALNFNKAPMFYEYILEPSYEQKRLLEQPLIMEGLILHRFDEQNTVSQVIAEIKGYCMSLNKEVLEQFSEKTGSLNVEEFFNRIDFLVYETIKRFLYQRILEFV